VQHGRVRTEESQRQQQQAGKRELERGNHDWLYTLEPALGEDCSRAVAEAGRSDKDDAQQIAAREDSGR
jgi:hypothetical protein